MKALDTIKYPTLTNLERAPEERQRDNSNQDRLNANFKRIADTMNELGDNKANITYVDQSIHDALDLRVESQTFTGNVSSVIVNNSFLVTSTMYVKSYEIQSLNQVLSSISWTTENGSLKITGSFTATGTKIIFYLSEVR